MKAAALFAFGQPLQVTELPDPQPGPGEVVIRTRAAGASMLDRLMLAGRLSGLLPHRFPLIPGWDVAGTVEVVGDGVSHLAVGDAVLAFAMKPVVRHGCWAEKVAVDAHLAAPLPTGWSFEQAASLPLAGLAAFQALFGPMGLRPGDTLLILGAAGAVGSYSIQLATLAGATVVAVDDPRHTEYLTSLGVETVLAPDVFEHHLAEDFAFGPEACLDLLGGAMQERALRAIKEGGILVSLLDPPDEELSWALGKRIGFSFVQPDGDQLRQLCDLAAAGQLRPPHLHLHRLDDAPALISQPAAGWGKTVLTV